MKQRDNLKMFATIDDKECKIEVEMFILGILCEKRGLAH